MASYKFHADKTISGVLIFLMDTKCIMEHGSGWSHEMYEAVESQQLYYASICFGGHRLGFILKTADDAAALDNAEQICAELAGSGTETALLSVSKVKLE